jgi:D-threo-aldose 1-dehydrogenase
MRFNSLSSSEIKLPELGFGASRLVHVEPVVCEHLVKKALQLGLNYFDTSPFYGLGLSERHLGKGLKAAGAMSPAILLSTKVGRILTHLPNGEMGYIYDYSSKGIETSLNESLNRLELDQVDMVLLHDISQRWHGERVNAVFDQVMADSYKTLLHWKDQGRVKAIGIGINDCQIALRALREADFDFLMLAGRTTLLDQEGFVEVLPLAQKKGKSILAAAPFNSGILASGAISGATYFSQIPTPEVIERTQRIERVCTEHQVSIKAASLQLPLSHPSVCSVIAGYQEIAQLEENKYLCEVSIDPYFWRALVSEGLLLPCALDAMNLSY